MTDFNFLGTINTAWSFFAMIIFYFGTEIFKWLKNSKRRKGDSAELLKKLNEHIKFDKDFQAETLHEREILHKKIDEVTEKLQEIDLQTLSNQIVLLLRYNSKEKIMIENLVDQYFKRGGNGHIKTMVENWRRNANYYARQYKPKTKE